MDLALAVEGMRESCPCCTVAGDSRLGVVGNDEAVAPCGCEKGEKAFGLAGSCGIGFGMPGTPPVCNSCCCCCCCCWVEEEDERKDPCGAIWPGDGPVLLKLECRRKSFRLVLLLVRAGAMYGWLGLNGCCCCCCCICICICICCCCGGRKPLKEPDRGSITRVGEGDIAVVAGSAEDERERRGICTGVSDMWLALICGGEGDSFFGVLAVPPHSGSEDEAGVLAWLVSEAVELEDDNVDAA